MLESCCTTLTRSSPSREEPGTPLGVTGTTTKAGVGGADGSVGAGSEGLEVDPDRVVARVLIRPPRPRIPRVDPRVVVVVVAVVVVATVVLGCRDLLGGKGTREVGSSSK